MTPMYVIVHHAAHAKTESKDTSLQEIDDWHRAKGWRGCGYTYVVRKSGLIEKGREVWERGAHCKEDAPGMGMSFNECSIGICLSGNLSVQEATKGQWRTLVTLCAALCRHFAIPRDRILGHVETGAATECPGTLMSMGSLREEVSAELSDLI